MSTALTVIRKDTEYYYRFITNEFISDMQLAYIFDDDDWKINKLFLKAYMRQALIHNR